MHKIRRGLASACALILLAGVTSATAPTASGAGVNDDTTRFFVLNNNIENRRCDTYDFQYLLDEVKKSSVYPDIMTLQQVAGQAELDAIKTQLQNTWGVAYEGEVSFTESAKDSVLPSCTKTKSHQANAVLWRTARFELATPQDRGASTKRWNADGAINGGSTCQNVPETINGVATNSKRSINLGVALRDRKVNKVIVAASVHWPKHPDSDEALNGLLDARRCLKSNMKEADTNLKNLIGDVNANASKTPMVIGGDMNAKTSINSWWEYATKKDGGLGYTDPIAVNCEAEKMPDYPACSGSSAAGSDDNRALLNSEHRTTQVNRIDYIFIKNASTTDKGSTIKQPTDKSRLLYSNHRAMRGTVKYL